MLLEVGGACARTSLGRSDANGAAALSGGQGLGPGAVARGRLAGSQRAGGSARRRLRRRGASAGGKQAGGVRGCQAGAGQLGRPPCPGPSVPTAPLRDSSIPKQRSRESQETFGTLRSPPIRLRRKARRERRDRRRMNPMEMAPCAVRELQRLGISLVPIVRYPWIEFKRVCVGGRGGAWVSQWQFNPCHCDTHGLNSSSGQWLWMVHFRSGRCLARGA